MPPKLNLLIDIDAKLRDGKGMGYKRWASVFNAKQLAQTMTYLAVIGPKPSVCYVNQRVHMVGPMAPAAYVAEDSLVSHQEEKRPLVL